MRYGGAKDPRVVVATMGRGGSSVRVRARVAAAVRRRCRSGGAAAGRQMQQQAAGSSPEILIPNRSAIGPERPRWDRQQPSSLRPGWLPPQAPPQEGLSKIRGHGRYHRTAAVLARRHPPPALAQRSERGACSMAMARAPPPARNDWFSRLFGFGEGRSADAVREHIEVQFDAEGRVLLHSRANRCDAARSATYPVGLQSNCAFGVRARVLGATGTLTALGSSPPPPFRSCVPTRWWRRCAGGVAAASGCAWSTVTSVTSTRTRRTRMRPFSAQANSTASSSSRRTSCPRMA
jgi:hypothetical protein